jgi:hypothetical protein
MGALCDSEAFRGGVSQKYLTEETSDIHISASDTLRIEFSIAASGGSTSILLSWTREL